MKIPDLIMGETPEELGADAGMTLTRVYWRGNTPIQNGFPGLNFSLPVLKNFAAAQPLTYSHKCSKILPSTGRLKVFP